MRMDFPAPCRDGGDAMTDANDRAKTNIRLALALGIVALGFFVLGLYLASGKGG